MGSTGETSATTDAKRAMLVLLDADEEAVEALQREDPPYADTMECSIATRRAMLRACDALIEALTWYSDEGNFRWSGTEADDLTPIEADRGARARDALARVAAMGGGKADIT